MPRTGNPPIRRNNAELQRRPVVRAAGTKSMHLPIILEDKHLTILETLDLALALLKGRDLREGGKVLQFVFLRHGSE